MAKTYEDSWVTTLKGPWTERMARSQKPCHYCGKPAAMREPGGGWPAHKACAQGTQPAGPLGNWGGEDHKLIEDSPYGCGGSTSPVVQGRQCGGAGGQLTCKLCPRSPTYEGPFA